VCFIATVTEGNILYINKWHTVHHPERVFRSR
jgi:hypothetical protein